MFGLAPQQTKEAGTILREIAEEWRGLVAGSEGFLTEQHRRGLYRQEVVWGEMVNGPAYRTPNTAVLQADLCFRGFFTG
jgi:hypothetical protein